MLGAGFYLIGLYILDLFLIDRILIWVRGRPMQDGRRESWTWWEWLFVLFMVPPCILIITFAVVTMSSPSHVSYLWLGVISAAILAPTIRTFVRAKRDVKDGKHPKLLLPIIAFLILPVIPYGIVEAQTTLFGRALKTSTISAMNKSRGKSELLSMKVMSILPSHAEVYVINRNGNQKSGDIYEMRKTRNGWENTGKWHCVWPNITRDNTFPPY